MQKKLGKKPARAEAIRFKFGSYFDRDMLPTPPMRFGHERIGVPWQVLGNDEWSNCVFAGAAHEHMVWTHTGGNPTAEFSTAGVLSDYAAVTGFNPADPTSDQGTDMQEAASYRRKVGVVDRDGVRHKIDAYVALRTGVWDDAVLATYMFGCIGLGFMLPNTAMTQFDKAQPWDLVSGSKIDGGHYVPCIGRNSNGHLLIVTWGRFHAVTRRFFESYCDEAVAYLSTESLNSKKVTPEGFDEATLRRDLRMLSK